jgi:nitrogen regulatory protein PII 2
MKEIMAVIRMDNINDTARALSEAGFSSMTGRKVFGRGKKKYTFELIEDVVEEGDNTPTRTLETISENHRLIAKRMMILVVKDEDVDEVVDIIIDKNQTGHMGDGKIFVLPVADVVRVRTSETGESAL